MIEKIFLTIFLVLSLIPALVSVIFANPRILAILWNFSWYVAMGAAAAQIIEAETGYFVTVLFMTWYLMRINSTHKTRKIFTQNAYEWNVAATPKDRYSQSLKDLQERLRKKQTTSSRQNSNTPPDIDANYERLN